MIGVTALAALLATPVSAPTITHSLSSEANAVASAMLPFVSAPRIYVEVIGGDVRSDRMKGFARANGIYYQVSGASEVSIGGKASTVRATEGLFIPRGAEFAVKAVSREPSTYLEFLLSATGDRDLSAVAHGTGQELFRSNSPIPGLREGRYVLNLSKVTLPDQAPPDTLHHRSGAAVHFVLSGLGAETINGVTLARVSGSVSYEPKGTVYQWSNPGKKKLTYLVFNLNPATESPVIGDAGPDDP